jgi:butyryl-CoA dehydrogenase
VVVIRRIAGSLGSSPHSSPHRSSAAASQHRRARLHADHAFDKQVPGALELALHAKVFGSETAVRVISDLMRVVGIDS